MKYIKTYEQKNFDINKYLSKDGKTLNLNDLDLTELPELPKGLKLLSCRKNNLYELPELPGTLKYLNCEGNDLPYKNLEGYWEWFWKENPDLWAAKQMGLY